jgi:26S proteasome regulatory subunit T2
MSKKPHTRLLINDPLLMHFPPMNCCRLLKLERVKDYLLMEEEFVANQERLKPQEDKNQEDRTKVDDLRGSPMSVGNLEEIIDENHAIVSSSVGPEYYVNILSFVDKDQLEPGCSILLHNKVLSVVGLLQDEVDPMVSVMKVRPLLELDCKQRPSYCCSCVSS